jgi:hypothetical protein
MTASKFTTFLFFFVLLFVAKEVAHAQNGVCRVSVYSIDSSIPHSATFSDSSLIREFNLKFEDNFVPEPFQHKESGITVFVSLTRFESTLFSKKPAAIKLAIQLIQLFKKPQDSYNFYGGEAETIYDKNWRGSSVSSHIKVDDNKGYTFSFACEKRKKRHDK